MEEWNVIVTVFRANGNESVGTEWTETKSFSCNDNLKMVFEWVNLITESKARNHQVRITIDQ